MTRKLISSGNQQGGYTFPGTLVIFHHLLFISQSLGGLQNVWVKLICMLVEKFCPLCCKRVGNYQGYFGWVIPHVLESREMFLELATDYLDQNTDKIKLLYQICRLCSIKQECTHVLVFNSSNSSSSFQMFKRYNLDLQINYQLHVITIIELNYDLCILYTIFDIWMSSNKLDVATLHILHIYVCGIPTNIDSKDSRKCKYYSPQ